MKRLAAPGALLLVLSCFGFDERLDACRRNEGVCAVNDGGLSDAGTRDAGCGLEPNDLLFNGSFELATDAGISGWTSNPPVIQRTTGAAACVAWSPVSVDLDLAEAGSELRVEILTEAPRSLGYDGFTVVRR